jgi:hypothetical protein
LKLFLHIPHPEIFHPLSNNNNYNKDKMAYLSKRHGSLSNAAPKKQKTQTWDPTKLLGYHCLEEQPTEVSSTLRRLLTPIKRTPNCLFRPPKSSRRRRSSKKTHVSSQPTSALCDTEEDLDPEAIFNPVELDANKEKPNTTVNEAAELLPSSDTASVTGLPSAFATIALDLASQGGAPSTTNQSTTTLASSKKRKAVHFTDRLNDAEPTPARSKRISLRSHVENPPNKTKNCFRSSEKLTLSTTQFGTRAQLSSKKLRGP